MPQKQFYSNDKHFFSSFISPSQKRQEKSYANGCFRGELSLFVKFIALRLLPVIAREMFELSVMLFIES